MCHRQCWSMSEQAVLICWISVIDRQPTLAEGDIPVFTSSEPLSTPDHNFNAAKHTAWWMCNVQLKSNVYIHLCWSQ